MISSHIPEQIIVCRADRYPIYGHIDYFVASTRRDGETLTSPVTDRNHSGGGDRTTGPGVGIDDVALEGKGGSNGGVGIHRQRAAG